ncbi:hypothetical protein C4N9_20755 [Pararhodobacter marinus]|uniref:Uncharacterized protein n=2 Tax=Pararhodobacter marinus TaxID=2184063 RepID=A0A2U2C4C0_9RHOB|nr:hypothetical protein C4N9_20755 [Pararhodobacter marinus]
MIAVADHFSRSRHGIGGNNPPDPIDEINAAHEAIREEAENWLDGSPVESEDQMKAVDELRKGAREWRMALEAGEKSAAAPLHDAWKAEKARWAPTIEDAKRIEKGLVALVDSFKRALAAQKAEAERKAREEAEAKMRAAQEAARAADAANIEAQREADRLQAEAEAAQKAAARASKDTVKGLRTVTLYEIEDHRAALHWIAQNDRAAMTAFIEEYVRTHHKDRAIAGVKVWKGKVAA